MFKQGYSFSADDILAERKHGEKMAKKSYKQGFADGYRKARIEFLGLEEVERQEREYDEWRDQEKDKMIAHIQESLKED